MDTVLPEFISIHAPREGGDYTARFYDGQLDISIHAPREGGRRIVFRHLA